MELVGVITSLFMLVFILNIVPDRNSDVREGRSALAEAIAVYSTALVKTAKSQRLRDDFNLLAERNKNLFSLALRHENGDFSVCDTTLIFWLKETKPALPGAAPQSRRFARFHRRSHQPLAGDDR